MENMKDKILKKIWDIFNKDKHSDYINIKENIKEYIKTNTCYKDKEYINIEIEKTEMILESKKMPYSSILYSALFAMLPVLISIAIDFNNKLSDKTIYNVSPSKIHDVIYEITSTNKSFMSTEGFKILMGGYILWAIYYIGHTLKKNENETKYYSIYIKVLKELLRGDFKVDDNNSNNNNKSIERYIIEAYYKKNRIKIIILILVVIVIAAPFILNCFSATITWEAWVSFLGSYLGGVFGGAGTLIAVIITTRQAKKHQEENLIETRKIQAENRNEQRRIESLIYMPILDIDIVEPDRSNGAKEIMRIYRENGGFYFILNIKNKGKAPCNIDRINLNCTFKNNEKVIQVNGENNVTENHIITNEVKVINAGESKSICIQELNSSINSMTEIFPMIYIKFFITNALGYKYTQIFLVNIKDNRVDENVEIMLPQWIVN